MLGLLIPIGGGDPIPLLKSHLIIGRRPSCDIRLEYANVSSHHCVLDYVNGYWRASDTSRNGTKVNGERIDERFLQPGDTLSFARHAYEIQYTPDPNAAPPVEDVDPFALSLLEKAGLQRERSERAIERGRLGSQSKSAPRNPAGPNPGKPSNGSTHKPPLDDDDRALEWLGE